MMMLISGVVVIIAGATFLFAALWDPPHIAKVGDVYVHANPGRHSSPFAIIYQVTEVVDGQAHTEGFTIDLQDGGASRVFDTWEPAYGCGRFDTQVKSIKQ